MKKNKIKFYKIHLVHNLLEDDPDRRLEFCSRIIEFPKLDPNWHPQITFSDESTFYRNDATVLGHLCPEVFDQIIPYLFSEDGKLRLDFFKPYPRFSLTVLRKWSVPKSFKNPETSNSDNYTNEVLRLLEGSL
ncbi:hypothetical protein J6590_032603 [Homalodisca vitripennis]|nr:hypothetical protein J6590_032603 [Homalodisca vitripennis]